MQSMIETTSPSSSSASRCELRNSPLTAWVHTCGQNQLAVTLLLQHLLSDSTNVLVHQQAASA